MNRAIGAGVEDRIADRRTSDNHVDDFTQINGRMFDALGRLKALRSRLMGATLHQAAETGEPKAVPTSFDGKLHALQAGQNSILSEIEETITTIEGWV